MRDFMDGFVKEFFDRYCRCQHMSELAWQLGGIMHCPFDELGYLSHQFVVNHLLHKFAKYGLMHAGIFWGRFYTGGSFERIRVPYSFSSFENSEKQGTEEQCKFEPKIQTFTLSQVINHYIAGLPTCPNNNEVDMLTPIIFKYNRKGALSDIALQTFQPQKKQEDDEDGEDQKLEIKDLAVDAINTEKTIAEEEAKQDVKSITKVMGFEELTHAEVSEIIQKQRVGSVSVSCLSDFTRIATPGKTAFDLQNIVAILKENRAGQTKRKISRGFLIGPLLAKDSLPQNPTVKLFAPTVFLPDGSKCRLLVYHYGPMILVLLIDPSPKRPLPGFPPLIKFINKHVPTLFYNFTQMLARMFMNQNQMEDWIRIVYYNYENLAVKYTNKVSNKLQGYLDLPDVRAAMLHIRARLRLERKKRDYCAEQTVLGCEMEQVKKSVERTSVGYVVGVRWHSRELYYLSLSSDILRVEQELRRITETVLERFLILAK